MLKLIVTLLLIGVLAADEAQAYLDPGTGSAMLQMMLAGLMGVLFVLKTYWRTLVEYFSGKRSEQPDPASGPAARRSEIAGNAKRDD